MFEQQIEQFVHGISPANCTPMKSPLPYEPFNRPKIATEGQVEAMLAKLKARHPQASEIPKASPEPSEEPPKQSIRWRQIADDTYESNKGPVMRKEGERFLVFDRRTTERHTAQRIGVFADKKTAIDFVRLLP